LTRGSTRATNLAMRPNSVRSHLLAFSAIFAVACSLDVTGTGAVGASASEPSTPSSGGGNGGDASSSTSDPSSPGSPDASVAEGSVDPLPECDKDNDGHAEASARCGGDDCCDIDPRTHPGQKEFFANANACGSFDHDCSGSAEPEFGKENCKLGFFDCNGDGFAGDAPCGVTASFTNCAWAGVTCRKNDVSKQQRCR
jgi:hypothetical protein